MSRNTTFYITNDDPRKVNKTLSSGVTYSCNIYQNCSQSNISLLITTDSDFNGNWNYLYFPDFNRYYFIDDIVYIDGVRCIVNGSVDVLMTYKDSIIGSEQYVTRCSNNELIKYNNYTVDSKLPINQTASIRWIGFSGGDWASYYSEPGGYLLQVV